MRLTVDKIPTNRHYRAAIQDVLNEEKANNSSLRSLTKKMFQGKKKGTEHHQQHKSAHDIRRVVESIRNEKSKQRCKGFKQNQVSNRIKIHLLTAKVTDAHGHADIMHSTANTRFIPSTASSQPY